MIYDVDPRELIEATAEELKKIDSIVVPEWAYYVKTGPGKDRQPVRSDWWYVRAAAILRFVFKNGPIGVGKLRVHFGARANRGYKPDKFRKAAGNHIRKILQQLESAGLVKEEQKGAHKGRVATSKGIALLRSVAKKLESEQEKSKKNEKKEEIKEEKKPKEEKTKADTNKEEKKSEEKKE